MNKTFVGFIFLLFLVGGVVSCQRSSSPYPYSLRYADSLMEISPERTLAFAKDYSNQLLAIDVNLDTTEMLDVAWGLFGRYFRPEEVNIKKDLVDQYWPKGE